MGCMLVPFKGQRKRGKPWKDEGDDTYTRARQHVWSWVKNGHDNLLL